MKILFLTIIPPVPPISGYRLRCLNIIKRLSCEHEVSVLSFYRYDEELEGIGELKSICKSVDVVKADKISFKSVLKNMLSLNPYHVDVFNSKEMKSKISMLHKEENFDVFYCNAMYFGQYIKNIPELCVLDQHDFDSYAWKKQADSHTSIMKRWFSTLNYLKTKRYESKIYPKFNICFSVSEHDRIMSKKLSPRLCTYLAPNGVDINYFSPNRTIIKENQSLLFTGGSSDRNYEAIKYFYYEILPYLNTFKGKIYIAGNMLKEKFSYINDERFIFTGRVNDIREFFNKSVVYIAPFKLGGGTKLKILEASSMELPVVATTAGARGIDLKNNESIFVAKNEKEFADNILKLLDDKELCSRVGKSARKIMEEKYDWNIIADNISSVMKNFKR